MGDHRIGEKARWRRGWPRIDVPAGLESVSPQWGFEQLTPITGRLTLDGAYIPMEMRTIFPEHPELNQLSHVMQIDFDELLAGRCQWVVAMSSLNASVGVR